MSIVRIQTVWFDPSSGALERFRRGVCQSLRYLRGQPNSLEVDVVFGDCSDRPMLDDLAVDHCTEAFVAAGARAFTYEWFDENLGHAAAQNRLLSDPDDVEFVFFLNPDTCLSPRALPRLVQRMTDPSVAIVEARQLPLEHQKAFDASTGDTSWASGGCSLVRRRVLTEIGGFDAATFFLHCDDVDLSWRARLRDYRVVHEPSAVVFHDKQLSREAVYVPSETEVYYSSLASVLLPAKYSRPDVVAERLYDLGNSPQPVHARVIDEYRRRESAGELASPIDADGIAGQFQTYAYADLRFDYLF